MKGMIDIKPLITLENTVTKNRISIYDDGRVYGKLKGQLYGILNDDSLNELKTLLKTNIYMFKTLEKYYEGLNQIVMRIRDDSRKHRDIVVYGWSQIPALVKIIHKTENLQDISI